VEECANLDKLVFPIILPTKAKKLKESERQKTLRQGAGLGLDMPSSARDQSHRHAFPPRDPLTTLFIFFVYSIFFCLFIILHALYYFFIKVVANVQWQQYIYSQARQRPGHLFQSWKEGLGLRKAGAYTAQKASEERLLKRGNRVRCMGRSMAIEEDRNQQNDGTIKVKKQKMLAPRHLALVVASKPVRLRVLLFRAFSSFLRGNKSATDQGWEASSRIRELKEKEKTRFAMESVETVLKCCALTGVEELSIFDEAGRIKQEVTGKGQEEWVLEWPLEQEWESSIEEDIPSYEYKTSRSDSFSSLAPSFTSALDSTPTLSKRPSNTSLGNLNDQQSFTASDSPRLRLLASLHTPFENADATLKRCEKTKKNEFLPLDERIYHTKIKVNLLGPEDGKGALARAASTIATSGEKPKLVDVQTIENILQGKQCSD